MTRDLQAVAADCLRTLTSMRIPTGTIREIYADSRSRRRWGVCRKDPDGTYRIGISVRLLSDDAPLQSLQETVFHELLHTVPDCMKHTGLWKTYADRLNRELGLHIQRACSSEEAGVAEDDRIRYRFICCGCGTEQIRYRACSFTKHPERYRCGKCGSAFRRC